MLQFPLFFLGDHIVMSSADIPVDSQQLTVRTLTQEGQSTDSLPAFFPDDIIQEIMNQSSAAQVGGDRKVGMVYVMFSGFKSKKLRYQRYIFKFVSQHEISSLQ